MVQNLINFKNQQLTTGQGFDDSGTLEEDDSRLLDEGNPRASATSGATEIKIAESDAIPPEDDDKPRALSSDDAASVEHASEDTAVSTPPTHAVHPEAQPSNLNQCQRQPPWISPFCDAHTASDPAQTDDVEDGPRQSSRSSSLESSSAPPLPPRPPASVPGVVPSSVPSAVPSVPDVAPPPRRRAAVVSPRSPVFGVPSAVVHGLNKAVTPPAGDVLLASWAAPPMWIKPKAPPIPAVPGWRRRPRRQQLRLGSPPEAGSSVGSEDQGVGEGEAGETSEAPVTMTDRTEVDKVLELDGLDDPMDSENGGCSPWDGGYTDVFGTSRSPARDVAAQDAEVSAVEVATRAYAESSASGKVDVDVHDRAQQANSEDLDEGLEDSDVDRCLYTNAYGGVPVCNVRDWPRAESASSDILMPEPAAVASSASHADDGVEAQDEAEFENGRDGARDVEGAGAKALDEVEGHLARLMADLGTAGDDWGDRFDVSKDGERAEDELDAVDRGTEDIANAVEEDAGAEDESPAAATVSAIASTPEEGGDVDTATFSESVPTDSADTGYLVGRGSSHAADTAPARSDYAAYIFGMKDAGLASAAAAVPSAAVSASMVAAAATAISAPSKDAQAICKTHVYGGEFVSTHKVNAGTQPSVALRGDERVQRGLRNDADLDNAYSSIFDNNNDNAVDRHADATGKCGMDAYGAFVGNDGGRVCRVRPTGSVDVESGFPSSGDDAAGAVSAGQSVDDDESVPHVPQVDGSANDEAAGFHRKEAGNATEGEAAVPDVAMPSTSKKGWWARFTGRRKAKVPNRSRCKDFTD